MLLLNLAPHHLFLLCLHLTLNTLHLHVLLKTLIVLLFLLFPLVNVCLMLLHSVLVLRVHIVVDFGFIHDLVQALRQHNPCEVLLVYLLLLELSFPDLTQMVMLSEEGPSFWLSHRTA